MDFDYILQNLTVGHSYLDDVLERLESNAVISQYFERMYEDTGKDRFLALADEVHNCHDFFTCDQHPSTKILDILRIRLCHNRFCPNCQKMIQATRLDRFRPFLLNTSETHDLFHLVFTVKNISAKYLKTHITILFEAFGRLVRFLRGTDKIKGVDLTDLGFTAALRALEVTFNTSRKDYHPHLHCIIALRKGIGSQLSKKHRNKFSYDYTGGRKVFKRAFSDFEIFLQKLWRLLIDQITTRVYKFGNKFLNSVPAREAATMGFPDHSKPSKVKPTPIKLAAIRALAKDDGYSVICDPVENDHFVQVFKYAFKLQSEDAQLMDYEQFKTIYMALLGRKTIQGYGDWYNLKVDDTIDQAADEFFDVFKAYLWQVDKPALVNYSASDLLAFVDSGEYRVITRRRFFKNLEEITESDLYQRRNEILAKGQRPTLAPTMPDLSASYFRYLKDRRDSPLFADLRRIENPDTGNPILILTPEQLNYLSQIF